MKFRNEIVEREYNKLPQAIKLEVENWVGEEPKVISISRPLYDGTAYCVLVESKDEEEIFIKTTVDLLRFFKMGEDWQVSVDYHLTKIEEGI